MTIPQSVNEWKTPEEVLNCSPLADDKKSENVDVKWFDYQQPSWGDTPEEKHERILVDKELTERGILGKKPTNIISLPEHSSNFIESPFIKPNTWNKNPPTNFEKEKPKQNLFPTNTKKVGPNDPCPCNSGTKYKKCHGRGKF